MKAVVPEKIAGRIVVIGYYQIIGGAIGIILSAWALLTPMLSTLNSVISVLMFMLFALSIFSGVLLMKSPSKGVTLSIISQCMQLFSFAIMGYAFQFCSGLYLRAGIDLTESFLILFNFGVSSYSINLGVDSPDMKLEVNLIACYLVVVLADLKKQITNEKDRQLMDELISG